MAISKSTCLLPPFRMGLNSRLAWPWPAWAEECAAHPSVRVASAALLGDGLAVTWELSHAGAAMVQRWAGFLTDADVSWGGAAPCTAWRNTGLVVGRGCPCTAWRNTGLVDASCSSCICCEGAALPRIGPRSARRIQASGLQALRCLAMGWL